MIHQIEASLRAMLEGGANGEAGKIERLNHELRDNEKKIANLIRLAEEGNIGGDSVRVRVNELEKEKQRIVASLATATAPQEKPEIVELEQEVARFVLDFERNFDQAPIEERKVLVQKCISKIVVDREANVARFYVRRVPAVTPILEEASNWEGIEESVMSNPRARNLPTGSLTTEDVMSNPRARNRT